MWISNNDEESTAIWELSKVEDRTAAITSGTILEARLTAAIKEKLYENEEINREMFRETGPLGPFGTKIRLGFMLGIYGMQAYCDLKRITTVRNMFAHQLKAKSFELNELKQHVMNLTLVEKHIFQQGTDSTEIVDRGAWQKFYIPNRDAELADPKRRFLLSVMIISTMLTPTVVQVSAPRLPVPRF
ncbi:MAG: hypothetical protein EOP09_20605 [Proteobacteria bacterium]|nr:MAG: hypothetical protein EOP09_20605 [Pseudomonadota bacterium]